MGKKDILTKDYLKDPNVFADAFNHFFFDGRTVVNPEKLHTDETEMLGVPYGKDGAGVPVQKFRDGLKYLTAMEDDSTVYLLLGIEGQSEIHYAMPVKNMVYDALLYAAQVEGATASRRKKRKEAGCLKESVKEREKGRKPGEYLSGFYKEDCLIPVITLVVSFTADPWEGPRSLHEMLAVQEPEVLAYVPDYQIHVLTPFGMSSEELDTFSTDLREVMLYIKYSEDKEKLEKLVKDDERFKRVGIKAARVMNAVTNSNLSLDEKEEKVDMCHAIEEIRKEALEKGMEKGRTEMVAQLYKTNRFSVEELAKLTGFSVEQIYGMEAENCR